MKGHVRAAWLLLACSTLAPDVHSEPPDAEANRHFHRALELVSSGDVDAAATEFETAYRISPRYEVLGNLGQAYALSGRVVEAMAALERYLAEGGDHIPAARREQTEAMLRVYARRVAMLTVFVQPPEAELSIDGRPIETGQPVRVAAGPHALLASLAAHVTDARPLELAGGSSEELRILLVPVPKHDGWLRVRCDLAAVTLTIDGVERPMPLTDRLALQEGTHSVSFARPGYVRSTSTIEVSAFAERTVDCSLTPKPELGPDEGAPLGIVVDAPGAMVWVDGAIHRGRPVPLGPHAVRVESAGFLPWRGTRVVSGPGQDPLRITLEPTAEARHARSLQTRRTWGVVAAGSAVAMGVLTGGLLAMVSHDTDAWRQDRAELSRDLRDGASTEELQRAGELDQRAASIQRMDDVAILTAAVGGALLGLSLELLLHNPPAVSPARSPQGNAPNLAHWSF